MNRFANAADYAKCRAIHRRFGTTYYFSTLRLPRSLRNRVHALYGFVRVPDEWVDNPGSLSVPEVEDKLREYRAAFLKGVDGVRPTDPVLRAFCDTCNEAKIPLEEPLEFLDAMGMDLTTTRYETYADLQTYMRGSAVAVGVMMCYIAESTSSEALSGAAALAEAMQLTNFLRDIREDFARGRIYLPLEDLDAFKVSTFDLAESKLTEEWRELIRFEIERARGLYRFANERIGLLPQSMRRGVSLASRLYAKILDKIEQQDYDVFTKRVRTTRIEKLRELFLEFK